MMEPLHETVRDHHRDKEKKCSWALTHSYYKHGMCFSPLSHLNSWLTSYWKHDMCPSWPFHSFSKFYQPQKPDLPLKPGRSHHDSKDKQYKGPHCWRVNKTADSQGHWLRTCHDLCFLHPPPMCSANSYPIDPYHKTDIFIQGATSIWDVIIITRTTR